MFLSLITKRRSIRKYTKKEVEGSKIDMVVEAALRAPSSRGIHPSEFIVVRDRDTLERLSRAKKHGSAFLKDAPLGIVVCADPEKSDMWVEDSSIASTFILLVAESLGLGSCWVQIRERMHDDAVSAEEYVARVLDIQKGLRVESIVAMGYPDEEKAPRKTDELQYEKVYLNSYRHPYRG
ncbi:MAG: NAD(P)H-dependent dehydrogenase/reductase [Proteobacteria bacterium]|nr:NAD(P)H-dependent dehydrogenase/reductase [Pseudomonadota bacterium]